MAGFDEPYAVRYTDAAREDLVRLFDFLLERANTAEDLDQAQRAIDAMVQTIEGQLSRMPFAYRKAGESSFLRELIITFGHAGYVALYEIEAANVVTVLAVRHQLEDDYH